MLSADFLSELKKHFRGEVRTDLPTRLLYSTDASIYQIEPLGVVLPADQDDLQAAVELAARYQIPILPRGSGSSLAGQAIGPALILDTSRHLDQILAINPEAQTATVEPGVILARLNQAAARHGLMFGPDPASAERATLGGVIANNATGAHSILYGMAADHLLSVETLLSDGSAATFGETSLNSLTFSPNPGTRLEQIRAAVQTIRQQYAPAIRAAWPRTWRNSAGYRLNYLLPWSPTAPPRWVDSAYPPSASPESLNLAPLLAGSEGSLAVIRRATLRLVKKPAQTVLAVLKYDSIAAACDDVPRLLALAPSAVELIPRLLLRLARGIPAYAAQLDFVSGDPAALLVIEFSGSDPLALQQQARSLGECRIATTFAAQARIWNVRKAGLGIIDSRPGPARPLAFIEDCALPIDHLGEFVREMERILAAHQAQAAYYAHASAGCLHIRPILDLRSGAGLTALRAIAQETHRLVMRLGGAMSSEHGDGLARGEFLPATYGEEVMEAFRLLKRAADPQNLLNPGKILNSPALDANLRYRAAYQPQPWRPSLDFSRQNGLTGAIEQCNGAGVCRKSAGVMCPSFQATRAESNATRGRANLLRALLNARHSPASFPPELDRAVYEAMGLCLACKGCKAECPSGVDMAKLKYEYQNEYYRTHRRPLRDYLFAYISPLARLAAPFSGLLNRLGRQPLLRRALSRSLQLAEQRPLPVFAAPTRIAPLPQAQALETVLFLPDAFTRYFEPQIEAAAFTLLSDCGIVARSLPILGAGRTLLSKGFLVAARRHAERLLNAIARLDPSGRLPVLGLEPSDLYTLRDELRDLLPDRADEVEALAARAWLLDEFLIRPDENGQPRLSRFAVLPAPEPVSVLLHGHCYQKAQSPATDGFAVGQAATAEFLRAFGYAVEIIPSGCCGMAGAFGYEAEHYAVSQAVGELTLFPAVRARGAAQVVAPGASCRTQIAEGAQAQALHPIALALQRLL